MFSDAYHFFLKKFFGYSLYALSYESGLYRTPIKRSGSLSANSEEASEIPTFVYYYPKIKRFSNFLKGIGVNDGKKIKRYSIR